VVGLEQRRKIDITFGKPRSHVLAETTVAFKPTGSTLIDPFFLRFFNRRQSHPLPPTVQPPCAYRRTRAALGRIIPAESLPVVCRTESGPSVIYVVGGRDQSWPGDVVDAVNNDKNEREEEENNPKDKVVKERIVCPSSHERR
jgi:hypothetical protein